GGGSARQSRGVTRSFHYERRPETSKRHCRSRTVAATGRSPVRPVGGIRAKERLTADHPGRDSKVWTNFIDVASTPPREEGNSEAHCCIHLLSRTGVCARPTRADGVVRHRLSIQRALIRAGGFCLQIRFKQFVDTFVFVGPARRFSKTVILDWKH